MIVYESNPGLEIIQPEDVSAALYEYRSYGHETFRHTYFDWADEHVGLYGKFMRDLFANDIKHSGTEAAHAAQAGNLLAAAVVRRTVEADAVNSRQITDNLVSHSRTAQIQSPEVFDLEEIGASFDPAVSDQLLSVKFTDARDICATSLRMLLTTRHVLTLDQLQEIVTEE